MGVHLRKLEQKYIKKLRKIKSTRENIKAQKKLTQVSQKAAVFADITTRDALPEETSILTAVMTAIKIALKEIQKKRRQQLAIIHRLSELYAVHRIQ